jgi:hypothetical protein
MRFALHPFYLLSIIILLALLGGCASAPQNPDGFFFAAQPRLPLDSGTLEPGLAVLYFKHPFVRNLDLLPQGEDARQEGYAGPPIRYLNHQFGRGNIFDSGTNRGIALEMMGYIKFERPGTYSFQANTNDGFRMYVDGRLLLDDPEWHSDRLTPESRLSISAPGWYSLRLRYFQRKGTATLQLYWKPPGEDRFVIVPPEVLAHHKSD